jgi:hypothetical protein
MGANSKASQVDAPDLVDNHCPRLRNLVELIRVNSRD